MERYSWIFFLVGFFYLVKGQPPIASRFPGHALGPSDAPILFEAYFDHACIDSKTAWPIIQQVLKYYGNNIRFYMHIFPLPYHHNAFYLQQGGLFVQSKTNSSNWWNYLNLFFDKQADFYNDATQDMTPNQVIKKMAQYATSLGVSQEDFIQGLTYGNEYDGDSRIEWKYSAARGIYGTPIFYLNGVFVTDEIWNFSQWKSVIDPLLK